jgi:hypothetical protein
MRPKTSLRFITQSKRVESKCFICEEVGHHKWFDSELKLHICCGCISSALASEKALEHSLSEEHAR